MMMPERLIPSECSINDERYSLAYIQREAILILRYLKKGKKHVVKDIKVYPKDVDDRILKRWGLK